MTEEVTGLANFQAFMKPALELLADGRSWHRLELRSSCMEAMNLTQAQREYRNSKGTSIAGSRVHWAVSYLVQAGLINRVARGHVQISEAGRVFLKTHQGPISIQDLKQFPSFQEFLGRINQKRDGGKADAVAIEQPSSGDPHDVVQSAVESVNRAVASDLLARLKEQSPLFLEQAILRLMRNMGYGLSDESAKHLGGPGDEGFDGVIHQDALGLDRVYLQAKRFTENAVGRPDIQKFAGALQGARASTGVFITTSRFSAEAREYASNLPVRVALIDGNELAELMVEYRVGVQVRDKYEVVQLDDEFFDADL